MGMFDGKKGLVFGIANDHSIAWAITQKLHAEGAEMGFTHLPDKDPERPRMERRLRKLVEPLGAKLILPCDVQKDEDLDRIFTATRDQLGNVDFVLHSIAYVPIEDLQGPTYNVSRDGFKTAMEISVYSLLTIARRSREILNPGGSLLTLTYLGGEKVIPGYNIMGICKAALESSVEYLANELGPAGFRINALSAGPLKTLSSSAVGEFDQMLKLYTSFSPLRRNITAEEVANTGRLPLKRSGLRRHRRDDARRRGIPHHGGSSQRNARQTLKVAQWPTWSNAWQSPSSSRGGDTWSERENRARFLPAGRNFPEENAGPTRTSLPAPCASAARKRGSMLSGYGGFTPAVTRMLMPRSTLSSGCAGSRRSKVSGRSAAVSSGCPHSR